MANPQNPPVEIDNYSEVAATSSSTRDDNNFILTRYALPALETRLQRYVLQGERQATIIERAKSPLVRFSVEEMIGFLEDAAIQVAMRTNSQYLQSLRQSRQPNANDIFDFSEDLRILGGTPTIDGTIRAQRVSEDHREDTIGRGSVIDASMPVYTFEGAELHIYGGSDNNPSTATVSTISLPEPDTQVAQGVYDPSTNVFLITSGDSISEDFHTLVNAIISDTSGGPAIRGILTDINEGSQNVRLEIDDSGFGNSGTITMTWKTPGYSSLNEYLEKAVVILASVDMFAAMGRVEAATEALKEFEDEMKQYGLPFFKI